MSVVISTPWLAAATLGLLVTALAGCVKDECQKYSKFTCKQLEDQTYNVLYYDTDKSSGEEHEFLLGSTIGLKSCGTLAWSQSEFRQASRDEEWSYVCCLKTKDSECAEKHR